MPISRLLATLIEHLLLTANVIPTSCLPGTHETRYQADFQVHQRLS